MVGSWQGVVGFAVISFLPQLISSLRFHSGMMTAVLPLLLDKLHLAHVTHVTYKIQLFCLKPLAVCG